MASKKKASSNGFSSFMFSYKAQEKAKGRDLDMGSVTVEAGTIWDKMSAEEKAKFKNKNHKREVVDIPVQQKYNCNGVSYKDLENARQREMDAKRKMELTIEQILLTAMENHELETHRFFLISVSYYMKRSSSGLIWPAELAMAEFSIQSGLIDDMHTIINPGDLPVGYANDAKLHAEETHRRPLPSTSLDGERVLSKIFDKIMEFMAVSKYSSDAIPPIYAGISEDDIEAAKLTLESLALEKGYDFNAFRVYPIEVLLFKLQKKCIQIQKSLYLEPNDRLGSVTLAKLSFENDEYAYSGIGCKWHNEDDFSERCCLSKVKRWVFIIAKHCIDKRFPLQSGQHYPETHHKLDEIELKSTSSKHSDCLGVNFRNTDSESGGSSMSLALSSRLTAQNTNVSCSSSWIGSLIKREQSKLRVQQK